MSEGGVVRAVERSGNAALWAWFGESRACWLTLPRVLMHSMPDDWQARMAALLNEFDEAFPNQPELCTRVVITDRGGRRIGYPSWLTGYRHPERYAVDRMRALPVRDAANG